MIELGKSLRAAREAKGLSVRQLAEQTRMAPTTIQDLEFENFSRIAAPIYGRGFVKLYCEAVGVDPKPYVDEFMEIFSGNRDPEIRERPTPDASASDADPTDIAAAEPPLPVRPPLPPADPDPDSEPDLFRQTPEVAAPPASPAHEQPLSRYAAPIRQTRTTLDPHLCLRLGTLAAAALLVLGLLVFGIHAVYRATTQTDAPEEVKAAAADKTARTPQKIPALYVD